MGEARAATLDEAERHEGPLVDVRKEPARLSSGREIEGSVREAHDRVAAWGPALAGRDVIVYCVHGHEVSQGAAEALEGLGIRARYLEGGFEAWAEAGRRTRPIGS